MIVIKKSHDDIGETGDIANIAIIASANFLQWGPRKFQFLGRAEAQVARQFSGVVLTFATLLPNAIVSGS